MVLSYSSVLRPWGSGIFGQAFGGGEMGRWGDGEMGRWGDGEMGVDAGRLTAR